MSVSFVFGVLLERSSPKNLQKSWKNAIIRLIEIRRTKKNEKVVLSISL